TSTRRVISTRRSIPSSARSNPAKTGDGATSTRSSLSSPDWPELPFAAWEATCDTIHMWTQIVGKTRMALTPLVNHFWNATLSVRPRGLTTSPIPYRDYLTLEVEFDFLAHRLTIWTSDGEGRIIALGPRAVSDLYFEFMGQLRSLGVEVSIHTTPDEF